MTIDITKGTFSPEVHTFYEYRTCGAPTAKTGYKTDQWSGEHVVGVSTPRFHKRMREGELMPASPWTKFTVSGIVQGSRSYRYVNPSGVTDCTYTQDKAHINAFDFTPIEIDGSDGKVAIFEQELIDQINPLTVDSVVTRALVNLASPKHDSLTFLAELTKVVSMFRNVGGGLANFMRNKSPVEIASLWMEGRYGWRTFVFDLQSISDALDHIDREGKFWAAKAGFSTTHTVSTSGSYSNVANILGNYTSVTYEINYLGYGRSLMRPPSFGGNLAVTAYEIVPFSFVLDWFLDIGQKIALLASGALDADFVSHYGVKVQAQLSSNTSVWVANTSNDAIHMDNADASALSFATLLYRRAHTPSVTPNFQISLDTFKVADIIAMVINAFSGRKR